MITNIFYSIGSVAERILPEFICGRKEIFEEKFRSRYGERDWKEKAKQERRRIGGLYFTIFLMIVPIIAVQLGGIIVATINKESKIEFIERPEYGENTREERIKISAQYNDIRLKEKIHLKIPARELNGNEVERFIEEYKNELPFKILGRNLNTDNVSNDLVLPNADGDVQLEWRSEDPHLIDEKGRINILNAKEGQETSLIAFLSFKNYREEVKIPITIRLPEKKENYKVALRRELRTLVKDLQQNATDEENMILPYMLPSGVVLGWEKDKEPLLHIAFLLLLISFFLIFKSRYHRIDKDMGEEKEAIEALFPEFISRLILLLSAGLVIGSAISKIVRDYEEQKRSSVCENNPLYEALSEVIRRVKETNASLSEELSLMARKSRVRQLMRFSAILTDSLEKGTPLINKLEDERHLIWQSRKKDAEKKGRIAETKLIFPLSILLLMIVIITISPVLINV